MTNDSPPARLRRALSLSSFRRRKAPGPVTSQTGKWRPTGPENSGMGPFAGTVPQLSHHHPCPPFLPGQNIQVYHLTSFLSALRKHYSRERALNFSLADSSLHCSFPSASALLVLAACLLFTALSYRACAGIGTHFGFDSMLILALDTSSAPPALRLRPHRLGRRE